MAKTVGELMVTALADYGVKNIWGVVGDALNPHHRCHPPR